MNSNIGPWLRAEGTRRRLQGVGDRPRHAAARPRGARQADGAAHAAGLRHARLQYPGHHQPDPRDRRFRARARRADLRRRRRLRPASGNRRAGARRRFLRVLALQDLRPASRRDVWPPRSSARARRPLPLFLRQGESVGQAGAGQPKLRVGLGKCRQSSTIWKGSATAKADGLSSARSRQSPTHEAGIGEQLLSWLRARNDVRIIGERGSASALRVPTISFTVEGKAPSDIVGRIDQAKIGVRHGDFHSRRLIEALDLAPGGADPRLDGALQHAGRSDPSHRSAGRRDALGRLNRSCGRPTGRTPRPW